MLIQSVIVVLCIPVLAGEICACYKFDSLLETLGFGQVNQQVVCYGLSSFFVCQPYRNYSNDNTSKQLHLNMPSYLAGLIEGDGSISVPTSYRSIKGTLKYASVSISFATKDRPAAEYLKSLLGHGSIHDKSKSNASVLTINGIDGLVMLVDMLNGEIRGGKYGQFELLVEYVNRKAGTHFDVMPINTSPLSSNAWLAGFTDADGSFQVRTSLEALYPRIALTIEISQAVTNKYGIDNFDMMSPIGKLFKCNLLRIRVNRPDPQYRVMPGSALSIMLVRNYFETYPLLSSKRLDFLSWCKIHDLMLVNQALNHKEDVLAIRSDMNNKRHTFNWDHLSSWPEAIKVV